MPETKVKQTKRKAVRKLSDIDFESDTSHIALVGKTVNGGPANGADYALVMKNASNFSQEFVEKASQIKVTMNIEEFLKKFFGMYWEDSEVLARLMGFTTAEQEWEEEYKKTNPEYKSWIEEKLDNFEILKAANSAESLPAYLASLNEDQYLALLQDQELIEKALNKESAAKAADDSTNVEITNVESVSNDSVNVEKSMKENEIESVLKAVQDEKVQLEKALKDAQQAQEAQKVELQKALESIAKYEQEKKEAVIKARNEQLLSVFPEASKTEAEVIIKAVMLVEDETQFQEVLKAFGNVFAKAKEAENEMFIEKGVATGDEPAPAVNPVAQILKQKYK